jgi:hypothetical protein
MTCMPPTLALAIIRMLDANGSNSVNTAAGDIAIDGEQYAETINAMQIITPLSAFPRKINKERHHMKRIVAPILIGAAILVVLWDIVCWETFKWGECRHVGHSVLYCLAAQPK